MVSPKEALSLKLIDEIDTADEVKTREFPSHKLIKNEYIEPIKEPEFSHR